MNYGSYKLLSVGNDAKTVKGEKKGYLTGILYLAPHKLGGMGNVCPAATKGCIAACLNTAGRGAFQMVQDARIRKTKLFFKDRTEFLEILKKDIDTLVRHARSNGMIPCVRLNGTSDLPWEKFGVMQWYGQQVQFYDYTKIGLRMQSYLAGNMPSNYHLTFSRSGDNDELCELILQKGGNVAAVFADKLPQSWNGYEVINGDESDLRFLDLKGTVVGLKTKGKGKVDSTGFVIR